MNKYKVSLIDDIIRFHHISYLSIAFACQRGDRLMSYEYDHKGYGAIKLRTLKSRLLQVMYV